MGSEVHGLRPDMRFRDAARPAIGQKLDEMYQHEAGTRSGDDIEDLHDMRVASRRLRAAMEVFAVCFPAKTFKPLDKMARSLTRALGEVRDRDVLLETLARYAKKAPDEERVGVNDLMQVIRDERELYRKSMLQTLDAVDNAGFRHRLYVLLLQGPYADNKVGKKSGLDPEATLQENAQTTCVERVANLYGLVPFIYDPANVVELHQMRIAAKHLRYALEIFRVAFCSDIDERIDDVKETQEQVGQIHDCDVLIEVLRRHLSVVAQLMHEDLIARAMEPIPHEERMARIRAAIQGHVANDPRPGILSLLGHKVDERNRRYSDFVHWWDDQQHANMRGKLYSCIGAINEV